jgi:hypothetical protein
MNTNAHTDERWAMQVLAQLGCDVMQTDDSTTVQGPASCLLQPVSIVRPPPPFRTLPPSLPTH